MWENKYRLLVEIYIGITSLQGNLAKKILCFHEFYLPFLLIISFALSLPWLITSLPQALSNKKKWPVSSVCTQHTAGSLTNVRSLRQSLLVLLPRQNPTSLSRAPAAVRASSPPKLTYTPSRPPNTCSHSFDSAIRSFKKMFLTSESTCVLFSVPFFGSLWKSRKKQKIMNSREAGQEPGRVSPKGTRSWARDWPFLQTTGWL